MNYKIRGPHLKAIQEEDDRRIRLRKPSLDKGGFDATHVCQRLGDTFSDFAEHTSAHGIPRAFSSRGPIRRTLWLLLFFFCLVAFLAQAVEIVRRFGRNDIIVGVELKFENIPFPSVTVCNLNPYKNSLAREMTSVGDTLKAFDDAMQKTSSTSPAYSLRNRNSRDLNAKSTGHRKLFERLFYSDYDGLLAVYSVCECSGGEQPTVNGGILESGNVVSPLDCKAQKDLKSTDGSTMCLCFYNRKNEQIWPCYPPDQWTEKRCEKCSSMGDCTYPAQSLDNSPSVQNSLPCFCAPVIRMCVRVREKLSTSGDELTNGSSPGGLADRIPKIWEISGTEPPTLEELEKAQERETAYGLMGMNDPVAIRSKASENLVFAVSQLSDEEKQRLGYTKKEFITKCSFNGRQCSVERDFSVYIDPTYGNCFTFNSNTSERMRSERAGANYGLRFQVFVNLSDYLPTTEAAGVRIAVHNQEEQPFPDTHGHNAPTGFVSSFGIRLKRVNRLPQPYGNCVQQGKTEEYIYRDKEYSTEGCHRSCIQRHIVAACGCGDPRFPVYLNHSNCPASDPRLRLCILSQIRSEMVTRDCICRQPCKEQVYSSSFSCAKWPASVASLMGGECDSALTRAECLQFQQEQSAMIEVYFEQLNYESLEEDKAYELPNLLSDFGGQLGLWMGVSVITIMEVGILISEIILHFLIAPLIYFWRRFFGSLRRNHSDTKNYHQNFVAAKNRSATKQGKRRAVLLRKNAGNYYGDDLDAFAREIAYRRAIVCERTHYCECHDEEGNYYSTA